MSVSQLWPTDAGIIMLCSNILINSWTNCSFYLLACSQAFPTVIVFMIMFQWYIVGGICSLSAIYPSISPTALFASFLAVCVVISNVCYLSDNNCFHVPVLCVSPGRYNLKIHSVIEFNNNSVQFSISNNCDFYLIFYFDLYLHMSMSPAIFVFVSPEKFRVPTLPRVYFGTKRVSVIHNPEGKFFDMKIRCFLLLVTMQQRKWGFLHKLMLTRYFLLSLSRMSSSQRCHREKTSCCLK